ncbi:hypothetical protein KFE96_00095 [Kordiimonas sp. SCSIO 12603]|uniref:hypothetical protein n=1 Tax=Kordiimonas sp. SCSIO 12603 TaxID=2829596 RepID=UPI0021025537|nr:hypothetical protein [Kordiimonas sp. SCSIO 12603]UTW58742.1 hypothetical protein KFE96_00095 [Kordiimonas sp. SCSIO 12603]
MMFHYPRRDGTIWGTLTSGVNRPADVSNAAEGTNTFSETLQLPEGVTEVQAIETMFSFISAL